MVKWYHTGFWYRGLRFESLWASQQGPFVYRLGQGFSYRKEGFDSPRDYQGGVAQLVRASACHAEGRGFESLHSRQSPHS